MLWWRALTTERFEAFTKRRTTGVIGAMDDQLIILLIVVIAIVALVALINANAGKRTVTQDSEADQQQSRGVAKVRRVIDGDTVIVWTPQRQLKVRLDAIDCPENGQHWGDIAKYGLIKMIGGRHVQLEHHGYDCYGRVLATIYVKKNGSEEWMNVNARMVTLGHAWVMRKYCDHLPRERRDELIRLERWARSRKVGLWKAENPIPPWRWRRQET